MCECLCVYECVRVCVCVFHRFPCVCAYVCVCVSTSSHWVLCNSFFVSFISAGGSTRKERERKSENEIFYNIFDHYVSEMRLVQCFFRGIFFCSGERAVER